MRRRAALLVPVLLLAFAVTACGSDAASTSSASTSTTAAASGGTKITIKDFAFAPKVLQVSVGASVTVANDDSTTHTWTLDDGSFGSDRLKSGDTASHTFDKAGTFEYHCEIHSSMKGSVKVS